MRALKLAAILIAALGFLALVASGTFDLLAWSHVIPDISRNAISRDLRYTAAALLFLAMYGTPILFLFFRSKPHGARKFSIALLTLEFGILFTLRLAHFKPVQVCASCDYSVAGVDLSTETVSDVSLENRFGRGCEANPPGWPGGARKISFLKAGIDMLASSHHIQISKAQVQNPNCGATRQPVAFGTSKGVNLGDDRAKVLAVYGTPNEVSDGSEESILIYRAPGKVMLFRFAHSNLVGIDVEVSP